MPKFQNLEEYIEHLRSQGVRVDVVGHNGSQPTVVRCGYPECRAAADLKPEPEVNEADLATLQPCETPGQLIDIADLANALRPGRKITIAIEAIAYDEEADE